MFGSGIPRLTRLTALRGFGRFFGFTFFAIATLQVFPAFGAFCRAMEAAYGKSSHAPQFVGWNIYLARAIGLLAKFCPSISPVVRLGSDH